MHHPSKTCPLNGCSDIFSKEGIYPCPSMYTLFTKAVLPVWLWSLCDFCHHSLLLGDSKIQTLAWRESALALHVISLLLLQPYAVRLQERTKRKSTGSRELAMHYEEGGNGDEGWWVSFCHCFWWPAFHSLVFQLSPSCFLWMFFLSSRLSLSSLPYHQISFSSSKVLACSVLHQHKQAHLIDHFL